MKKTLLFFACAFVVAACTPQPNAGDPSAETTQITMAWKTMAAGSPDEVNLHLVLSIGVDREIDVGTFSGELLTAIDSSSDPLLYREWWSGTDDIVTVTRKDDTRLSVQKRSQESGSSNQEIIVIDIPANMVVMCVDDEEGCG